MKPRDFFTRPFIHLIWMMLSLLAITDCQKPTGGQELYYHGTQEKIALRESSTHFVVKFDSTRLDELKKMLPQWGEVEYEYENAYILRTKEEGSVRELVGRAREMEGVLAANPIYLTPDDQMMGVTDVICLAFKEGASADSRKEILDKYNARDITSPRAKSFYLQISVPKNAQALQVANEIQESGLTTFAHPDFLAMTVKHYTPSDPYYARQFYLHNIGQLINDGHTGTTDADIDAEEAWEVTRGSNTIRIAVLDEGVVSNNNDLPLARLDILPGCNFASGSPNDPSPVGDGAHGTACSGIIAAEHDNGEGVSGVAPFCRIMPVRIPFGLVSSSVYANAINFAWSNNADVLSNSWGYNSTADIPVITAAINSAATSGRGGIGAVVVFSAGNTAHHAGSNNGFVSYPGNVAVATVLTVGASDRNDQQANYSPDGAALDVVAPSHLAYSSQIAGECFEVWSTDITGADGYNDSPGGFGGPCPALGEMLPNAGVNFQDYTGRMGGTSAACPEVAGLAALMLSVTPSLTPAQVFDCITQSCDKVGGYTYTGGKSVEMGFGRINARNALSAHLWARDTPDDIGVEPNRSSGAIYLTPDIWVRKTHDLGTVHENPEYRDPLLGQPNYVYVRVRNAGCMDGAATVKLYWAKASTGLSWPAPWDGSVTTPALMGGIIGTQPSGTVPGHSEVVLEFQWYPPDPADYSMFGTDQQHFCLLARFERTATPPYGMTSPETGNLGQNVLKNNNIIWKNITVVDEVVEMAAGGGILIANFTKTEERTRISFTVPEESKEWNILRQGQAIVKLSDELLAKWKRAGGKGEGIEVEGNTILIKREGAWIGGFSLKPGEIHGFDIQFKLDQQPSREQNPAFLFDITQYALTDNGELLRGGERYVIYGYAQPKSPQDKAEH
ncbi:MAG: S8 family serine peptidase [Phaeodactylibacter sp.]|nr:S8 family serine peptidase [Phaeodactylibacter sp.]